MKRLKPSGRRGRWADWFQMFTLFFAAFLVPVGQRTAMGKDAPSPAEGPKEKMGGWTVPPLPAGGKDWMQAIHAVLLPDGTVHLGNGPPALRFEIEDEGCVAVAGDGLDELPRIGGVALGNVVVEGGFLDGDFSTAAWHRLLARSAT